MNTSLLSASFHRLILLIIGSILLIILLLSEDNNVLALTTILNDSPTSSLLPLAIQKLTNEGCQAPLLQVSNITDDYICLDECCMVCPYLNNFYQENLIDYTYKVFSGFGIVSFFLMILLCICFLILPSQRKNPITIRILLPFVLSVAYFEASQFFVINQKQTLCSSDGLATTTVDNSRSCKFQAIFSLGGAYAMGYWSAILMTHLHMLSIWRSEFIMRNIHYFHGLGWSSTLLAIIVPFATNNVANRNNLCFISSGASLYYFIFLSFICIAFVAHIFTFVYIAKITLRANWRCSDQTQYTSRTSMSEAQRAIIHVKYVINVQWRALTGAFLMLIVYVVDWAFFASGTEDLRKGDDNTIKEWVTQWMNCTQNPSYYDHGCNSIAKPHVQPYSLTLLTLFFNSGIGILMFIVFAAKKSIILEAWRIMKGDKSICYNPADDASSVGTASFNYRRSIASERRPSLGGDEVPVKSTTFKEWLNTLYNKYLKSNDLTSKSKLTSSVSNENNGNNNNSNAGGHTTIVIGKIRDFSSMASRNSSGGVGVGGQELGYNSYSSNVDNDNKKPHNHDNDSRSSTKRYKHEKYPSDALSLHMSNIYTRASIIIGQSNNNNSHGDGNNNANNDNNSNSETNSESDNTNNNNIRIQSTEMARASFGLDENSLSSILFIKKRYDGSNDGDINNLPISIPSPSPEQVSNTVTTSDDEDSNFDNTILEFHTPTGELNADEIFTKDGGGVVITKGDDNNNNNNCDINDKDSSSVNLYRTETFGSE